MSFSADEDIRQTNELAEKHPPCPWCGGPARLEWTEYDGSPGVTPRCAMCGMEAPTGLPVPGGPSANELLPERIDEILAPAWYSWDHAFCWRETP
jgi:hypothetical protein